jgi:UDP-glucose 4-epimerase
MSAPNTDGRSIVVTGGAGFIGSHVVDALVERGHRVIVVDDLSTGRAENVNAAAELRELDIRSTAAADLLAEENVGALYHLAAQMDVRRSTEDPVFDASVNVLGTLNLLQAAVTASVGQVIFASTGGAIYGEQEAFPASEEHPARPVSPYGVSKLAAERYLFYFHTQYGLNATCLRFANVYGERQNPHGEAGVVAIFMNKLLRGDTPIINGDGLQTRDYIHVSDVVAANIAALGEPGFRIYNVGTGVETDVVTLYREIATSLDAAAEARHGPGMPGEQRRSSVDASLLRSELGVPEPLPLAAGIARTAAWFKARD